MFKNFHFFLIKKIEIEQSSSDTLAKKNLSRQTSLRLSSKLTSNQLISQDSSGKTFVPQSDLAGTSKNNEPSNLFFENKLINQ